MLITKTSCLTGMIHTMDLPVTQEQIDSWKSGELIQNAMPHLDMNQREFLISGSIPEEWEEVFGEGPRSFNGITFVLETIAIMKEKIENLIKEVGVNEVETILKQMKSKVNVKEEVKKDFIELLTGCIISFDGDDINYRKDGYLLFYYQKNENIFRLKYDIWSKFKSKYNLNNQELKELLVGVVEDVLNYKGVTPEVFP